jgi:hypothetical protein
VAAFGAWHDDRLARCPVDPLFVTALAAVSFLPARRDQNFNEVTVKILGQSRHRQRPMGLDVEMIGPLHIRHIGSQYVRRKRLDKRNEFLKRLRLHNQPRNIRCGSENLGIAIPDGCDFEGVWHKDTNSRNWPQKQNTQQTVIPAKAGIPLGTDSVVKESGTTAFAGVTGFLELRYK